MENNIEIIDVNLENVGKTGFFCYMSKRKSPGYCQKLEWLEKRLAEEMKIKIIHKVGGRDVGFIEYIPGEHAWRAVQAPGYLVIHCLWVVGKGKRKGYGALQIAQELGLAARVVELNSAQEVQETAPCSYGVFGIVHDGRLLGYHYLGYDRFQKALHLSN